jgi:hypothetical protein
VVIKNKNFKFSLNGIVSDTTTEKLIKKISDDEKLSGSIEYSRSDERSTYFFNLVNSESIISILKELSSEMQEVKIEIQTYDGTTKQVQQKSFENHDL